MDLAKFAKSDTEAVERATIYENDDPFKEVPRSLLSSVEILDYARLTGMLHPFDPEQLKSASYEVHLGGEVIWWDGNGDEQTKTVRRGSKLVLKANSIVFAQVEPIFRLPNYIAIRFNLRITHVHRGLLLGTGPLVDPGFHGQLMIPLHNLTSEDYEINTNDALIWVEFTKTTFGYIPPIGDKHASTNRKEEFREFPEKKRHMSPQEYLKKANDGRPIRSSIPAIVLNSQAAAETAETEAKGAREEAKNAQGQAEKARGAAEKADASVNRIQTYITWGAIAAVVALAGSLYQIGQQFGSMLQNVQSLIVTLSGDSKTITEKVTALAAENKVLTDKSAEMKTRNDELAKRNDDLAKRIDELGGQVQQRQKAATPARRPRAKAPRRKQG